jgi:hypothetical protein
MRRNAIEPFHPGKCGLAFSDKINELFKLKASRKEKAPDESGA